MSTVTPPESVAAAMEALRAAFDEIHVMHECDDECPVDCDLTDYSDSAQRAHDEHNFDVREVIHDRAEGLVGALEDWLGAVRFDVGAHVELRDGVTVPEGLEDSLCRVVRVEGDLRDVRRVNRSTGELEGIEVRFLAAELRSARPSSLAW